MSPRYTKQEIEDALRSFQKVDLARLKAAADYFSRQYDIPPEDLIQAAALRLLRRSCDKSHPILGVLLGMIKSIAWGSRVYRARFTNIDPSDLADSASALWRPNQNSVEDEVIALIDEERLSRLVEDLLKDKPVLRRLFVGRRLGLEGPELQEFAGIPAKAMESNMKALKRRLARLKEQYDEPQI
jgi:hypothetical protein